MRARCSFISLNNIIFQSQEALRHYNPLNCIRHTVHNVVQRISRKPRAYSNKTYVVNAAVQRTAQTGKLNVSCAVQLKKGRSEYIPKSELYLTVAGWEGAASQRSYLQLIQLARPYVESLVQTWQGSDRPWDLRCIQGSQSHPTTSVGERGKWDSSSSD